MLKYDSNMTSLVQKYQKKVSNLLSEPSYDNATRNQLHTKYIADCQRGSREAKEYVLKNIYEVLYDECEGITDNDAKEVIRIVKNELNTFNQKQYEVFNNTNLKDQDVSFISYYQLLSHSMSNEQKENLHELELLLSDKQEHHKLAVTVLANEIYKSEYGLDVIEDIFEMKLNNIEVHDTEIHVEDSNGVWYKISDIQFKSCIDTQLTAKRLLNQNSGGDLTEDECQRQTNLLNGSRITVSLKKANSMDTIFIKKFDSFNVSKVDMLNNGTVTEDIVEDLRILAKGRANMIFSGGVNAGKSTFLKMYIGLVPNKYKIGLIDPTRDTDLNRLYPDKDIITLYPTDEYTMNDQFSFMLTMNRDIIGISEAKSYEVLQAIKGMTRGNSGSFLTMHSLMAKDIVDNIAWMCLENGIPQDMNVLRYRVANAIDICARVRQLSDGKRVMDDLSEIVATGDLYNPFEVRNIWKFDTKTMKFKRNPNYKPSNDLLEKLEYYGCTEDEIRRLKNGLSNTI